MTNRKFDQLFFYAKTIPNILIFDFGMSKVELTLIAREPFVTFALTVTAATLTVKIRCRRNGDGNYEPKLQ